MSKNSKPSTARGLKPTRRRGRVEKNWGLLVQMQKLIDHRKLSVHKAARVLAENHWSSVSKNETAGRQWFRYKWDKFRDELRPGRVFRLIQAGERIGREPTLEEQLRKSKRLSQEFTQKWNRDHPGGAAYWAAKDGPQKIERWHEWFRQDPKGALARMLVEINGDDRVFYQQSVDFPTFSTKSRRKRV